MANKTVGFIVEGRPVGKERARVGKHGAYTPKKTKKYEEKVALFGKVAFKHAKAEPLTGPVGLRLTISRDQVHVKVFPYAPGKTGQPDISNVLKAIEDGLNGIAYKDDKQVAYVEIFRPE